MSSLLGQSIGKGPHTHTPTQTHTHTHTLPSFLSVQTLERGNKHLILWFVSAARSLILSHWARRGERERKGAGKTFSRRHASTVDNVSSTHLLFYTCARTHIHTHTCSKDKHPIMRCIAYSPVGSNDRMKECVRTCAYVFVSLREGEWGFWLCFCVNSPKTSICLGFYTASSGLANSSER